MFTFLDLLIVVFMVLLALALVTIPLMFLLKNKTAKKICFYVVTALALYVAYGGMRIGLVGSFDSQLLLGLFVGLVSIASLVVSLVLRKNEKVFLITRIASASVLVLGMLNAFII